MILVDTSVWVDHLRAKDQVLVHLLEWGKVIIHPMVIGELACGSLNNRSLLLGLWQNLPQPKAASHDEAVFFLNSKQLMGKGVGWVDVHLLASVFLTPGVQLWTRDNRLASIAHTLNCHWLNGN